MLSKQSIIGVIGSGAMGSGIAQVAATALHKVLVYDNTQASLTKAEANLKTSLQKLVEKQKISDAEKTTILSNIVFVSELFNNKRVFVKFSSNLNKYFIMNKMF